MPERPTNPARHAPRDDDSAYHAGYEDARPGTRDRLVALREHGRPADLEALLAIYRGAVAEQTFGGEAIAHMRRDRAGHGLAPLP